MGGWGMNGSLQLRLIVLMGVSDSLQQMNRVLKG